MAAPLSQTPTPSGALNLYVEGSAPRSGITEAESLDSMVKLDLPGFNHMPINQSAIAAKKEKEEEEERLEELGTQFEETCRHVVLAGLGEVGETTLEAKCVDNDGQWWDTSLNLNECMANERGRLVYHERGSFDKSCRPCLLDDPADDDVLKIKCRCLNEYGRPQYAYLTLGSRVSDQLTVRPVNGRLICGDRLGLKTPSF